VFSKLLCRQPAARPANVPELGAPAVATTTRQRFESQHEQGACAACHQTFEPFGYGLEHFDENGLYRAAEGSYAIDAQSSVSLDDGTTIEFDGLEDLATKLAARADVADCVGGLLASYAFGGAGGQACLAEDARASLAAGRLGLRDYFASLATAPSFTARSR
jgi:hypothetical protein